MRPILPESRIHPDIQQKITEGRQDIVREVEAAIAQHRVVVVGMAVNPNPARARRYLKAEGIDHHYLEYGSYLGEWRRRTALKMWTGWHTFPMVFVDGILIGGADDTKRMIDSGWLKQKLASVRAA